jgi:rhamnosyltransferase
MTDPLVSILLPTWNGAQTLRELLPALSDQDYAGDVEVHAFDSGSVDGTLELLELHGAEIKRIDRREFSHGGTRNQIASTARGEFFVFLSQDVVPRDQTFLRKLLEPFSDGRVAGTSARVLPFPGSDPLTARTVLDLPEAEPTSFVRDLDAIGPVWAVDAATRVAYLRFNNVASAIRADVFHDYPFPEVEFGEDFAWAARVLTAGYRIAYTADSVVYHGHHYTPREAFRRYRVDAAFHRAAHGWNMRPSLLSVLRGVAFELKADLDHVRAAHWIGAKHLFRAPALRTAQVWGQYRGAKNAHVLDPCRQPQAPRGAESPST